MLDVQIIDVEQGSEEWLAARAGVVTASRFKDVLAKGQGKTRAAYLYQLAGEIITGQPMETYRNAHMERGHEQEPEARNLYALMTDYDPQLVGFIKSWRVGCSPDGVIGDDGLVEIKSKLPHLMAEIIDKDKFPPEHVAQCQGALWVTGREWIDLAVYCPGFPLFVKRMERDQQYIDELSLAVDAFISDLDATVERIKAYGGSS